jgi:hypothetical protein
LRKKEAPGRCLVLFELLIMPVNIHQNRHAVNRREGGAERLGRKRLKSKAFRR